MTRNVGQFDRAIRLMIGVMLLGLYGALPAPWRYLTLAGIVLIATAAMSFCPLYPLIGVSTCAGSPKA